jgi:hypothetical protein
MKFISLLFLDVGSKMMFLCTTFMLVIRRS